MSTFSRTVICGKIPFDCGTWTIPRFSTSPHFTPVMSVPSSSIRPSRGRSTPRSSSLRTRSSTADGASPTFRASSAFDVRPSC